MVPARRKNVMIKTDKKDLASALEQLNAVKKILKRILNDEQNRYEKMESRQRSQKGEERENVIQNMEDGLKAIKRANQAIEKSMP